MSAPVKRQPRTASAGIAALAATKRPYQSQYDGSRARAEELTGPASSLPFAWLKLPLATSASS